MKVPALHLEGLTEDRSGYKERHPTRRGFQALQRLSSRRVQGFLGHFLTVGGFREKGGKQEQETGARVGPGSLGREWQTQVGQAGWGSHPTWGLVVEPPHLHGVGGVGQQGVLQPN